MRFTELLPEIAATYPEQPRQFHVLATRFYIGAETVESLRLQAADSRPVHKHHALGRTLTNRQVAEIIANR